MKNKHDPLLTAGGFLHQRGTAFLQNVNEKLHNQFPLVRIGKITVLFLCNHDNLIGADWV